MPRRAVKYPPGAVASLPGDFRAHGDGVVFRDGAIQAGDNILTSATITPASLPNAKVIYIAWAGPGTPAGKTSAALGSSALTSLPRTSGPAITTPGPVLVSASSGVAQLFYMTGQAAADGDIPVLSQVPIARLRRARGLRLSTANTGMITAISAVADRTATLADAATSTVQNIWGWYGSDDSAAWVRAMRELGSAGGGKLLVDPVMHVLAGPLQTGSGGNAIVPLPLDTVNLPIEIEGRKGGHDINFGTGTRLLGTRLRDEYSHAFGPPSVIGGPTTEQVGAKPRGPYVILKDFDVITPDNQALASIDLDRCEDAVIAGNVRAIGGGSFTTDAPYGYIGQLNTCPHAFGLRLPSKSNNGDVRIGRFEAYNCYVGLVVSEHTVVGHELSFNCTAGLAFPAEQNHAHMNVFGYVDIEGCPHGLVGYTPSGGIQSPAPGSAIYVNGQLDFEDQGPGGPWAPVDHVLDANHGLIGECNYYLYPPNAPFIVRGAARLALRNIDPSVPHVAYDDQVLVDSPTMFIPNDELSGTIARDLTGNGHMGSHKWSPRLGLPGPDAHYSAAYDGVRSYTLLDTLGDLGSNLGTSTIEFWFHSTATSQQWPMGTQSTNTGVGGFAMLTNSNQAQRPAAGHTAFVLYSAETARTCAIAANIYDGTWHHIVMQPALTGTSAIWVDGRPVAVALPSRPRRLGSPANFDQDFALGARNILGSGVTGFAACRVAKFAVYVGAQLSPARIGAHYKSAWHWFST